MIGALDSAAISGIQTGVNNLQKNAELIVTATTSEAAGEQSLLADIVDLKTNVMQVASSMKVLDVSEKLIGGILDIKV